MNSKVLVSHIFFDLQGILIDTAILRPRFAEQLGVFMNARYGVSSESWTNAHQQILADWDSYYADLDLGGDEGIRDWWEGMFRTTRALFRLTGIPEPAKSELTSLSREIQYAVSRHCDALYPDVKPILAQLHEAGYILGITSHSLTTQTRGLLEGGSVLTYFKGPIVGPDNAERFLKDEAFFLCAARMASVEPAACVVVEGQGDARQAAKNCGMATYCLRRGEAFLQSDEGGATLSDLAMLFMRKTS